MAFGTPVLVKKEQLAGGDVREEYTWSSDGGTTTGSITADATIQPEIKKIVGWCASSNGDTAVIVARDAGTAVAKLTFTANDSGTLTIWGPSA